MTNNNKAITQLHAIRNRYGKAFAAEKEKLLNGISVNTIKNKPAAASLYEALLFIGAYPDNKTVQRGANVLLQKLEERIRSDEKLQYSLYNTGITATSVCAAFSFEMVKWIRKTRPGAITLNSLEAGDAQVQSILSVVMTKAESEIMQDANAAWKGWLKRLKNKEESLLDQFIAIFDSSDIRPEVKDELWNAIGINVAIEFTEHCSLPASLVKAYYHRSLIKDPATREPMAKPVPAKLDATAAQKILDCCRMILVRKLRELDPVSFTEAGLISFYQLERGFAIALMGMQPERRHPLDSYMGYVVFKNGLPVAYAGSWILFDSARISLNIFTDYRGGESKYIFDQVLQLHAKVYGLKRFTVDPYQLGKENSDGIDSGAFWIYYRAGFRPLQKLQQELAAAEAVKIKADKKYRSPAKVLRTLANSRMQLVMQRTAVNFDAIELSEAYAAILSTRYKGDRSLAEKNAAKKLAAILHIKNAEDPEMNFVLKNWALLLLSNGKALRNNRALKQTLKKLFVLKASGSEEAYITGLQQASLFRKFVEEIISTHPLKSISG